MADINSNTDFINNPARMYTVRNVADKLHISKTYVTKIAKSIGESPDKRGNRFVFTEDQYQHIVSAYYSNGIVAGELQTNANTECEQDANSLQSNANTSQTIANNSQTERKQSQTFANIPQSSETDEIATISPDEVQHYKDEIERLWQLVDTQSDTIKRLHDELETEQQLHKSTKLMLSSALKQLAPPDIINPNNENDVSEDQAAEDKDRNVPKEHKDGFLYRLFHRKN